MSMPRKTPQRGKAFWPALGLMLALASAGLSYAATPSVIGFLKSNLRGFPNDKKIPIIVGVTLFALIVLILSLIVAFAVPRKKSAVTEIQISKDRKAMVNEKMARKIKQREINRQGKAR